MTSSNALHEQLCLVLKEKLAKRRIVVWYDARSEFHGFISDLAGSTPNNCELVEVLISGQKCGLSVFQGSFFEAKFAVESLVNGDLPDPLLIYVPGFQRHDPTAVLMELEAAGERWEPQLKREARRVLKKHIGDGQIDQLFSSDKVTYRDIVAVIEGGASTNGSSSLLDVIYQASGSNAEIISGWISNPSNDSKVCEKGADVELRQLLLSRLGIDIGEGAILQDARRRVARYVLLAEFRNDLLTDPPGSLSLVSQPTKDQLKLALEVAELLRHKHAESYVELADSVEVELQLAKLGISPSSLGKIDTFRFEERVLLDFVGQQIIDGEFENALSIVNHRRKSFWAIHQLQRQEQWQAFGLAAELGLVTHKIAKALPSSSKPANSWVELYAAKDDGWYLADMLHRRLESTLAAMSDSIASERVVHRVRTDYEQLVDKLTAGFVSALKNSNWSIPEVLHQTHIYADLVNTPGERVCYFLVDALRYEMAVELMALLENAESITLVPAIGAIPTITPIGMAALMPGAERSFSVVGAGKDVAARIEQSLATGLADRRKIWQGRVPDVVDLELEKVLSQSNSVLQKRIADAPLVIVRSIEIDALGEGGNTLLARQVMDTMINNVARAVKRLASMGISKFVVVADHGHLFIGERDESERIDKPGGDQVAQHRRCWAGRGGATPSSTIRVTAAQLGYDSDFDFVFPTNNSVFKSGGDLSYYHGGLSLQELIVPALVARMAVSAKVSKVEVEVSLTKVPTKIANRIVSFGVSVEGSLFGVDEIVFRPVLLSNNQHVGHVGMVLDAEHDATKQCVKMKPGGTCTVGVQLLREDVDHVEIVILDPESDRILAKSKQIPVKLGI
jgi:hypothetical protein